MTQSMSEIGAVDSPFRNAMNYYGFSLLGIFIILFAFGFICNVKYSATIIISLVLLLISGMFMFLVGFFPCDAGCIDVTRTGELHSITSTVPAICLPLAAMVSAASLSDTYGKRWGSVLFLLGVISMGSGPLMFVSFFESRVGFIQRMGIGFSMLWMVVVSIKVLTQNIHSNN